MHDIEESNLAQAETLSTSVFPTIIYGGDYNPEQWPESTWHEDARLMREAGINLVSLGIFAWARSEPQPGVFDFAWLDAVMNLLHEHGVRVNLGTGTPAPPPWLAKLHPESLPVTADGVTLWPGSRRHYSPHSSAYRSYAARFVTALAERYHDHPALVMWHIDNEYGCHISECFGPEAAGAYRIWLQRRYGTLEKLNEGWGSTFWGQIYGAWDEIHPPRRAPYMHNPSALLDWKRFSSDAWLACYEEQRAILRCITPHVPVTTNFMGFHKPLDYWTWAAREDVVANDSYPEPSDPASPMASAMECDLIRSLGGRKPWILMEQATSHVNWRQRNTTKAPGQVRIGSYQAVARGANGVMFFQWRASKAGGEQFHSAMIPHGGAATRTFREVAQLGTELKRLADLRASRVNAEVAILFDYQSWWALESEGKPSGDVRLLDMVRSIYAPLYARNIAVDFAHPEQDLSRYRLVLAPHLYLVSEETVANLKQYVEDGGTLLMTFMSGMVDSHNHIRLGGYPAPFRELLGLWVEEIVPYAEGQTNETITDEEIYVCSLWSDVIALEGAEPIAHFRSDFYAGYPAITRYRYGQGKSYYLGTALDANGMDWLLHRLATESEVSLHDSAREHVEIVRRSHGSRTWKFVLNHGKDPVDVELNRHERDLLSGICGGVVRLAQYGIAIVVEREGGCRT